MPSVDKVAGISRRGTALGSNVAPLPDCNGYLSSFSVKKRRKGVLVPGRTVAQAISGWLQPRDNHGILLCEISADTRAPPQDLSWMQGLL
jgi:hypothetical protein